MERPKDIPQDVWDAAQKLCDGMYVSFDDEQVIARAILAERERCAKVAETPHEDDDRMDRQIRNDIAAAIRVDA